MSIDEQHTISELTPDDTQWINYHLGRLRMYLEHKSGQKLDAIPEPKFLDQYVPAALADVKSGAMSEEEFTGIFGAGFGQYFEEQGDFRWVVFSDKYGTDLAVRNTATGVIGFPVSSAGKLLKDDTAGKFDAIYVALTGQ